MNIFDLQLPSKQIDVVLPENQQGYCDEKGEDTRESFMGLSSSRSFPKELWIEPREWKEFAESVEESKGFGRHYRPRYTHQGRSHECTSHSDVYNAELCYMRSVLAPSKAVFQSPLSLYCRVNPGRWGGANIMAVMRERMRRGCLPEKVGPNGKDQSKRFKHVLHGSAGGTTIDTSTSGPWLTERRFEDGWEDTARLFVADEMVIPSTWEEGVCLVLHGFGDSVGRQGHAICYNGIAWRANDPSERPHALYSDSYNIDRADSFKVMKSCIGKGYAYTSMAVLPDEYV